MDEGIKMAVSRKQFYAYLAELSPVAKTLFAVGDELGRSLGLIEIAKEAALDAFLLETPNTALLREFLLAVRRSGQQPYFEGEI